MKQRNTFLDISLIVVCCFLIVLSYSLFKNLKKLELEFNQKKAVLVKDNLELKDRIGSISDQLSKQRLSIEAVERERNGFKDRLDMLKQESDRMAATFSSQTKSLREKNEYLKKSVKALESLSITRRIQEAVDNETDDKVKRILVLALEKIELVKAGKPVNLDTIVVTRKDRPATDELQQESEQSMTTDVATAAPMAQIESIGGMIVSVDQPNNLMVINLGSKDRVSEGDRVMILRDGDEIGQAEVLSVRYRVSAAFIDDIQPNFSVKDIREGQKVVLSGR